jgi:hypothetical protein
MSYDSKADTLEHIREVNNNLIEFATELLERAKKHDQSKLEEPEKSAFDNATDLKTLTFGTKEYHDNCLAIKPALEHHYSLNSHHPQHYPNGVEDMNLYDIVEMWCDWNAAVKRGQGGDINKSLEINEKRFKINSQLIQIFKNTL